jgi:acetyl-CoA carboxylase biotin carboxyl carrier protein
MSTYLELETRERDGRTLLVSPSVGTFSCARTAQSVLVAGDEAGVLVQLGKTFRLRVPAGISGRIVNQAPERVRAPVGYGDVLYELSPLASESAAQTATTASRSGALELVLRAEMSGRFYHRSAPGEPAFTEAGAVLRDGQPVGLLEVMKTFSHVLYRAQKGLPASARVVRVVAKDGGDIKKGDVLLELEPGA